jgi:DNA polymerase-3 subunit alpha
MGKKKVKEMETQRQLFCQGASERGIGKAEANRIFDLLEKFANYGFNKSHSAAYGMLSYQTAYLKAHFPVEFAAALLTVERANSDKVAQYVADARHLGIEVLPPDINESRADFTPLGQVVRFGLYGIKNVGDGAVEHVLNERERAGTFKDLADFCRRIDMSLVNKRALEHLIKAGAFDGLDRRSQLLADLEGAMKWGAVQRSQAELGQFSLFGTEQLEAPKQDGATELSELELLRLEKEALGLYISAHPMQNYPGLSEAASCQVNQLEAWFEKERQASSQGKQRVVLAGILQNVVKRPTRRGSMMARFEIADQTGSREILAFSRTYERIADRLDEDAPVVLVADLTDEGESIRIVADEVLTWNLDELPKVVVLELDLIKVARHQLEDLRSQIDLLAGITPLRLRVRESHKLVHYAVDGIRLDAGRLEELEHSCPWLTATVTVNRERLLGANGSKNGFGRKQARADVPF